MTERIRRLRRSVLFTPGMRGDRIQKAHERRAADAIVADLEDAVAPDEKAEARTIVRETLEAMAPTTNGSPERCVRINAWRSEWAVPDLEAVVPARPDTIVLPKAGPRADLVTLDLTLTRLERQNDLPRGAIQVMPILETASGILAAKEVAAAPRVSALAFGAEDLAADAGLRRTPDNMEVLHARSHVALAAAARRIDAIDQVFVDIGDKKSLTEEARFARTLGYRGKMVIHPDQVDAVHTAFTPSVEEIEEAKRLVDAVDGAEVETGGVLRFEGRMIDVPLIEQARRVLEEAKAASKR